MAEKRIGSQYPTRSVVQAYKTSKYLEATELYEKSGRTALPWQKNLMKPIMAENEEGLWTHTKVGYSLPRRNGKNEIVIMRELYGLVKGEAGLHTAHRVSTSHSAWEKLVRILKNSGYKEDEAFKTLKAKIKSRP